jgi:hypothetical protein
MGIRNNGDYDIQDMLINNVSIGTAGTKPGVLELILNPTFNTPQNWIVGDEDINIVHSTSGGTITGGETLYSVAMSANASTLLDISSYGIVLSNDDILAISFRTQTGNSDTYAGVSFSNA